MYDFQDFVGSVKDVSKNVEVVEMEIGNFYKWMDMSSQQKLSKIVPRPYIQKIIEVQVVRGQTHLLYRNDFSEDLIELNFIQAKHIKSNNIFKKPAVNMLANGIPKTRKTALLSTLQNLIPNNRMEFWKTLPITEETI